MAVVPSRRTAVASLTCAGARRSARASPKSLGRALFQQGLDHLRHFQDNGGRETIRQRK
jgi:hypothetical protein